MVPLPGFAGLSFPAASADRPDLSPATRERPRRAASLFGSDPEALHISRVALTLHDWIEPILLEAGATGPITTVWLCLHQPADTGGSVRIERAPEMPV
jgi:hypothetical protein